MTNHKSKTILLVDDEKDITDLLEEVLRRDGFKAIYKAHNGKDAALSAVRFLQLLLY